MQTTIDLTGRTILFEMRIRVLSGEKRDKAITQEICASKGASRQAVRANKSLFGDSINQVRTAEAALREFVGERTLPWLGNLRIVKTSAVSGLRHGLIGPIRAFDQAVEAFIAGYEDTKAAARRTLGQAYSEADFPPVQTLRARFGVETNYLPMPKSDDFRVALDAEELAIIRNSCDQALRDSMKEAVMTAVGRLRAPIERMSERLHGYGKDADGKIVGAFRDTLVENVRDMIAAAEHLNITDDPRIAAIAHEMKLHLAVHDADALRVSPHLRDHVAEQADRILAQLDGAFA